MEDYDLVKSDFNEIAELDDPKWNHNSRYYSEIVDLVPDDADTCLDIGCGKGDLAFSYLTQVPFSSSGSHGLSLRMGAEFPLTASSMSWTSLWAVSTSGWDRRLCVSQCSDCFCSPCPDIVNILASSKPMTISVSLPNQRPHCRSTPLVSGKSHSLHVG